MKLRFPILLVVLLLTACSTYRVKNESESRPRLYPNGTYRHSVVLTMPDGKTQSFQGVVSLSDKQIVVVGLSAFGTTVFRLKDDLGSGKQEVEIFIDQLKKHDSKLREFYALLKRLLLLPAKGMGQGTEKRENNPDGLPVSLETSGLEHNAKLFFEEYDAHKLPLRIRMEGEKFKVEVTVIGYDI